MVPGERRILGDAPDSRGIGWHVLAGGAALFVGKSFTDERGSSFEIADLSTFPENLDPFSVAQENLVVTEHAGTARGLHYQVAAKAQAKLVTVVDGTAQFFWLPVHDNEAEPRVHSIVLRAARASLYTPATCAHGFLALEERTSFILRMDQPVSPGHRGEISLLADDLSIDVSIPIRRDLLSERDRDAPCWADRRVD